MKSEYTMVWFIPYKLSDDGAYRDSCVYLTKDMPNGPDSLIGAGEPLFIGTEDECKTWITVAESSTP